MQRVRLVDGSTLKNLQLLHSRNTTVGTPSPWLPVVREAATLIVYLAGYPSGLRGRIANPLFMGSNPIPAFPILCSRLPSENAGG